MSFSQTFVPQLRTRQDGQLQNSWALPAAGASTYATGFDVLGDTPNLPNIPAPEDIEALVTVPALPNNTSTSDSVTFALATSTDNATWSLVADAPTLVVTGVASTGSAATFKQIRLPANGLKRYVTWKATATSGAGNNTAVKATSALVF